ncbi:MAG: hypothetical protein M3Y54_08725 [Bacteroidota bacterium]|nr:hypothetical protein [Bacteroidota bacterium]
MLRPRFATYPASVRLLFAIYSLCFLAGTCTHVVGLVRRGFLAFPVPLPIGVFWDALTLLDPLTVLLLWWHPKAGIRLGLGIMLADICVNTYTYLAGYWGPPVPNMVPLHLFDQALFGVFLFATAPLAFHRLLPANVRQ